MRLGAVALAGLLAGAAGPALAADIRPASDPPAELAGCEAPTDPVTVGAVACRRLVSGQNLGGETAFSYVVPDACAPPASCPAIYLLHGFGGDHRSMLGTSADPSAYVHALTRRPPADPREVADPWRHADPATWVPAEPIDAVLIAPHGRTLPGGHGPAPGLDGFWTDWNPKYAAGGSDPAYPGPPPRFESFIIDELIPYVESTFPVGAGRTARALAGVSLGGYGTFALGLRHPDVWAALDSISGAHNFLFVPAPDPVGPASPEAPGLPEGIGHLVVPGVAPHVPVGTLPPEARGFAAAIYALGDPAVDQAYYRGHMPRDLAANGRVRAGAAQALAIREIVNDAVPRRAEDIASPPGYLVAQAFEGIVLAMTTEMEAAFRLQGVQSAFELHPGIHSGAYWNPWLRGELEWLHERVRQREGGGSPAPAATTFDHRATDAEVEIWGWSFTVTGRPATEMLTLTDVSCAGLTLRGTGRVAVEVPPECGTGLAGSPAFTVDLGASHPVDEPAGAGAVAAYGTTRTVRLTALG